MVKTTTTSAVLRLRDAAALLILPQKTVLRLAEERQLPGRCIDGEWRFSRAAILDWLAGTEDASAPPPARVSSETPEEYEAFMANIRAYRDEVDRAMGSGKYAPE